MAPKRKNCTGKGNKRRTSIPISTPNKSPPVVVLPPEPDAASHASDSDGEDRFKKIGELTPNSKGKWVYELEEKLCRLWHEHEPLYDTNHADYTGTPTGKKN